MGESGGHFRENIFTTELMTPYSNEGQDQPATDLTLTALKAYFSSRVPAYTPLRNVLVEVIAIALMEILSNCPVHECEPVTERQWLQAALAMQ